MRLLLAIVAVIAACAPEEGPLMAPGQDCLECHDGGRARHWTAAGTWTFGAHVDLVDSGGKTVPLRGNKVGNFYTAESLSFPLTVYVDGQKMTDAVTYGGCNLCHVNGVIVPPGPDMTPGRDCLKCHDGTIAKRFYAGGTWTPGATVPLTGANGTTVTLTASATSGNFYTETPLTMPLVATVGGQTMSPPPSYGGCNLCHGSGGATNN
jgi:hypothetical protein